MKNPLSYLGSWRDTVVYAAVTLLVSNTLVGPVFIPSGSMEPTLQVGDYLVVNRVAYGLHLPFTAELELARWSAPQRGDIIVFNVPASVSDGEELYIKRVVALAGDIVQVRDDRLTINGQPAAYQELGGHTLHELLGQVGHRIQVGPSQLANFGPYQVPAGHVFVMGDHRDDSLDSRAWGALPLERVRGQAVLRLFGTGKASEGFGRLK